MPVICASLRAAAGAAEGEAVAVGLFEERPPDITGCFAQATIVRLSFPINGVEVKVGRCYFSLACHAERSGESAGYLAGRFFASLRMEYECCILWLLDLLRSRGDSLFDLSEIIYPVTPMASRMFLKLSMNVCFKLIF